MDIEKIDYPYDTVIKYLEVKAPKLVHIYLDLPGEFVGIESEIIIDANGTEYRADMPYKVDLGKNDFLIIDLEHQSSPITKTKIRRMEIYKSYLRTKYGYPVLSVVLTNVNPEKSHTELSLTDSELFKPVIFYFSWEEIEKRLNNLTVKIKHNEKLNLHETLDIGFLPIITPKAEGPRITDIWLFF